MVQANDACRVDEHVAAKLFHVTGRIAEPPAPHEKFGVDPPRSGAQNIPPSTTFHPVRRVKIAWLIHQESPTQIGFTDVGLGEQSCFECHDDDFYPKRLNLVLVLSQLRQMLSARQSAEVTMEYQQQPTASVIRKAMKSSTGVRQLECDGRRSHFRWYGTHL